MDYNRDWCYEDGVIPARRSGFAKLDECCGATAHRRINRRTRHVLPSASMFRRRRAQSASWTAKAKLCARPSCRPDPEIIVRFIAATGLAIERIGLESGCTAAWLRAGLQRYGWPVICIDARHAAAALQAGFATRTIAPMLAALPI
jgi:hypothetical protein